jgi:flavodoxin
MYDAVLFYSRGGRSLEVAKSFNLPMLNVCDSPKLENLKKIIIVCPTYGDEELPLTMEDYLIRLKTKKKIYSVCELGNYFGHEKEFGVIKIIDFILKELNWKKVSSLSLDSVPEVDWKELKKWTKKLLKN